MGLSKEELARIDAHVGQRLKKRRKQLGYSQEYLANKCGITFQQIQKYERGQNRMGSSRLYQICQILEVPITYFFEAMDDDQSDDIHEISLEELAEIKQSYSRIGIEEREALKFLMQVISNRPA